MLPSPVSLSPARRANLLIALASALLAGCGPAPAPAPARPAGQVPVVVDTARFTKESIGLPFEGKPWISHVVIADLDRDGRNDVLACDDKLNGIVWLRQAAPGKFTESTLMAGLPSPVHVEAVDMDGDRDLDLLVSCMGEVFPNNDKIGSVVILENDGAQQFTKHVIADRIARVTDIRAGDFDGDGRLDLAVGQFGYDQGEIRWMRNLGNWQFESKILLNLSGTINVCVADLNGDRTLDIVALVSQQWEEIHLFENDGKGNFTGKIIFGSTNEDYGSSGLTLGDLNRDGRPDLVYTNGDGFAYADPGKRPWHGVQWLENVGNGNFRYHRIADLPGAYAPVVVDLEGRGVMDIVCTSGFNDWQNPASVALVAFRNDGQMNFTMHVLAHAPIQLITCAAGDLDGTGRTSIVTAGFYSYPPFDRMDRFTLWRPAARP
ncbi:FG-GAP repeat protein [Lacunisphaera limnophila]|uniref:FG-GAP repeat protein n=1 Tax=Lacunisphaera limnophila TaxID=1838286 RepID=A0A1D8ARP3_9BACT|nr:VCBS repeat-containing protein [Lacunisphaera limnophila]AOS43565.1 FG-GAP repeat protein [Lacunisphaera limnophila]